MKIKMVNLEFNVRFFDKILKRRIGHA